MRSLLLLATMLSMFTMSAQSVISVGNITTEETLLLGDNPRVHYSLDVTESIPSVEVRFVLVSTYEDYHSTIGVFNLPALNPDTHNFHHELEIPESMPIGAYTLVVQLDLSEVAASNENTVQGEKAVEVESPLEIRSVSCPGTFPKPNASIPYEVTIRNTSNHRTGAQRVGLFQEHSSTEEDHQDPSYGYASIPELAPNEETSVLIDAFFSENFLFPNNNTFNANWGDFYLSFRDNGYVKNFPVDIYCQTFRSDLAIEITAQEATYDEDFIIDYKVTITNNGPATAHNVIADYAKTGNPYGYLGNIGRPSSGRLYYVGESPYTQRWYIPQLAAGESATLDIEFNILNTDGAIYPFDGSPFQATASVNSGHLVDSSPINNQSSFSFYPEEQSNDQIDLKLELATDSPFMNQYESGRFFLKVSNTSTVSASSIGIDFPFHTHGVVQAGGSEIIAEKGDFNPATGMWRNINLAAGESASLIIELYNLNIGEWMLFAEIVRARETDVDSTPNNFTCCAATEDDEAVLQINHRDLVDLTISDISIPDGLQAGQTTDFSFSFENIGDLAVNDNFSTLFFLSNDAILSSGDVRLARISTEQLGIGARLPTRVNLDLPDNLNGDYYLLIIVDAYGQHEESNEANNKFNFLINIQASNTGDDDSNDDDSGDDTSDDDSNDDDDSGDDTSDDDSNDDDDSGDDTSDDDSNDDDDSGDDTSDDDSNDDDDSGDDTSDDDSNDDDDSGDDTSDDDNNARIDLELSLSTDNPTIRQFESGKFTMHIQNKGAADATGVVVYLPLLGRATIMGGTEVSISQGELSDPSTWRLDLAAGESATYEVQLHNLMYRLELFAQVIRAAQDDMDSTPDNGYCCTAFEDDEAAFPYTADEDDNSDEDDNTSDDSDEDEDEDGDTASNLSDLTLSKIDFPTQLALVEHTRFELVVENIGQDSARGDFVIGIYLSEDELLTDADTYIGHIQTANLSVGQHPATALVSVPGETPVGTYYMIIVADVDEELNEANETNNYFFSSVQVQRQNGVDLELSMTVEDSSFPKYTANTTMLTLTNAGNEAASGVQVSFPLFAAQVVLVGGTSPDASQGTFNSFTGIWDIQEIAAGATVNLSMELYPLADNFLPYAQVSACEQEDIDSTPNNGVCCSATEDDEAMPTSTEGLVPNGIWQSHTNLQLAPNPASEVLKIQGSYDDTASYKVYDIYGKTIRTGKLDDGEININRLESGTYYLQIEAENAKPQLLRFVKIQ